MSLQASPLQTLDVRRPFSRADARAAGITLSELLSRRYHRVLFDRYVSVSVAITPRLRAETALGVSPPGAWVSHHTAATLWGGIVPDTAETHLTVPELTGRSTRRGVRAHTSGPAPRRTTLEGLPVSTPEQCFLDLAAYGTDLVDLVVLGDSLVHRDRTTPQALIDAALRWRGRGAKRARRAAGYVRAGVDSVQETRLRMLLVLAGLAEPTVNLTFFHDDGSWRRRFDLCYPSLKLAIEYDGRQHAEDSRQWQRDLQRREELDQLGWRIIVVTADDLYRRPEQVLIRVRDAMRDRGAKPVRTAFKTEWIRHFAP